MRENFKVPSMRVIPVQVYPVQVPGYTVHGVHTANSTHFAGEQPTSQDDQQDGFAARISDFVKHPKLVERHWLGSLYRSLGEKTPLEKRVLGFYRKLFYPSFFLIPIFPVFMAFWTPYLALQAKRYLKGFFTPSHKMEALRNRIHEKANSKTATRL